MKEAFMIFSALTAFWFLQADYYGKTWTSIIPKVFRQHSGYQHK